MAYNGYRRRASYEEIGRNSRSPFEEDNMDVNSNCARIFTNRAKFVFFIMAIFTSAVVMSLALSMVWIPVRKDVEPSATVAGLQCYKCGDDGKCQNNATESLITCANEEMTCMLKSQHEEQYVIDVKDCYNAPDHLKMVGCLKITSDMPGGEDEHICLCDKDGCNEKMCPRERCDCAFADPNNCIHVDDSAPPISCRHCEGEDCRDGKNGELKECTQGESACIYVNAQVKNNTIISRACFYEADGARIRGCVQVEEGDDFTGEVCYCDTDDCNQQTCDHRDCDCAYSNPKDCIHHYKPTGTSLKSPNVTSSTSTKSPVPAT